MATTARLDLTVWRNDDVYEFPLRIRGPDLTGASLRGQIRLAGDTPGPPIVDLATVTNANAEGFRLASVSTVDGVLVNDLRLRLNKTTRQALPYAGELGDAARVAWSFLINGVTRIEGAIILPPQVFGSDAAPTDRPEGYGMRGAGALPSSGATLTIAGDDVAVLTIDGADLLGPIVADVAAERVLAEAARAAAAAVAEDVTYLSSIIGEGSSTDLAEVRSDTYGLVIGTTDLDGREQTAGAEIGDLVAGRAAINTLDQGGIVTTVVDSATAIDVSVDPYGMIFQQVDVEGRSSTAAAGAKPKPGRFMWDRLLIPINGQSLSRGFLSLPPLSTTQPYGNRMPSFGVVTYDQGASGYGSMTLAPLIEQPLFDPASGGAADGETPNSGLCNSWTAFVERENGVAWDAHQAELVGASVGVSATPLSARIKGTTPYGRFMALVARVYALSQADGLSFAVPVVVEIGGESDMAYSDTAYLAMLKQYRIDLDADLRAIIGPDQPTLRLLISQVASHSKNSSGSTYYLDPKIARAQYQATIDDPHILIADTPYHRPYADGVHLTAPSSRGLGGQIAKVAHTVVTMGEPWTGVRPIAKRVQGRVMTIDFAVPLAPLVLDNVFVTDPGHYGFELLTSALAPLAIERVTASDTRVTIVATASIPAGAVVQYAHAATAGQDSGPRTGARGCLRDSDERTDASGTPLFNVAPIFRI